MTKIKPPKVLPVDDFIKGANQQTEKGENEKVKPDPLKSVALRLPESYATKLQWISEQTDIPQQKLLRNWLRPMIDAEVKKLTSEESRG